MPEDWILKNLYDRQAWFQGGEIGGYENYDQQTEHSIPLFNQILATFDHEPNLSVLDIGCGYGTHLALAADRGWKCFGVEVSSHARTVANERHGAKHFVVEDIAHLIPHEFDLVVLFDVLEHLKDPYELFYALFSKGAITPRTKVVITTPNARCSAAIADPGAWTYRHPPSHLVYFSAASLDRILRKLRFKDVRITGQYPITVKTESSYGDETSPTNAALSRYEGLLCEASGSDFISFMHERYVPGTWSKIAEYEHIPRYMFARTLAAGMHVLDFGCGAGYGAALLAEVADSVIGVDIDESALQWAGDSHRFPNLRFECRSDLGAGLPDQSFDIITCFEMIEHVDEITQIETMKNFSRLLKPGGLLVISTPNPEITKNYGPNPYHVREMNEQEFRQLLGGYFSNLAILHQRIRPAVSIDGDPIPSQAPIFFDSSLHGANTRKYPEAAAFVAVCSNGSLPEIPGTYYLDSSFDYVADAIKSARNHDSTQLERYRLQEKVLQADVRRSQSEQQMLELQSKGSVLQAERQRLDNELTNANLALSILQQQVSQLKGKESVLEAERRKLEGERQRLDNELTVLEAERLKLEGERQRLENELSTLQQLPLVRLGRLLKTESFSIRKILKIGYLVGIIVTPARLKDYLRPYVLGTPQPPLDNQATGEDLQPNQVAEPVPHYASRPSMTAGGDLQPYRVTPLFSPEANRARVAHALANFMMGGTSRLVVDLIEHLGHKYEQEVITSFIPDPPAYSGLKIYDCRDFKAPEIIQDYFARFQPHLVHIHYWGDVDKPWYEQVFAAAERHGCKILENVVTPVEPFLSPGVARYIYVSNYVLEHFGHAELRNIVAHPGSNFNLFAYDAGRKLPEDCIGMVYRLEPDKLNETSIEVFIKVAQRRPKTKILIVGGGKFFEPYRDATRRAGVMESFVFTGYVAYEELPKLYEKMSVFVAPVWQESFGQVTPFAMNMGIPVAGYNVGGLAEIVADPSLLAPAGDSHRLADVIIELLENPERRKIIGAFNHARAHANFSVEAMVRSYERIYEEELR